MKQFKCHNNGICYLRYIVLSVLVYIIYCVYSYNVKPYIFHTKNQNIKYILYWNKMFGYDDMGLGFGNSIFKNCPVNNCMTTMNRTLLRVQDFDAVIFHGPEHYEVLWGGPSARSSVQVYIYFNMECPLITPWYLSYSYGFYNWTMTYRTDSEVFRPYGRIVHNNSDYKPPTVEDIQKRPKKIAWMVSHCGVPSQRDMLAKKIAKHIPVDIYGACGDLVCSKDDFGGCYDMIVRNYKFYLSFENSVCKDYVTEKMYYALKYDIVPIVYGGADYEKFAPPNSVIDVTKFQTVKELTDYLKHLDENPEEYLKYFEWKKSYYSNTTPEATLCELCEKLNQHEKIMYYEDVINWLNKPNMCKTGNNLPPIVFS